MRTLVIFTHAQCEPVDHVATLLQRLAIPFRPVCLATGDSADFSIDDVSGFVFMGGPGDVNQATESMRTEMQWIKRAHMANVPVLGICLGAQMICHALGGEVCSGDQLEIGWHPVELLPAGQSHPWFSGLDQHFDAFHWHAHSCLPPPGAEIIARSYCTPCQAFTYGPHLGVQFHLEMSPATIESLIELYATDLETESDCVHKPQQILENIAQKCERAFATADLLIPRWLQSLCA